MKSVLKIGLLMLGLSAIGHASDTEPFLIKVSHGESLFSFTGDAAEEAYNRIQTSAVDDPYFATGTKVDVQSGLDCLKEPVANSIQFSCGFAVDIPYEEFGNYQAGNFVDNGIEIVGHLNDLLFRLISAPSEASGFPLKRGSYFFSGPVEHRMATSSGLVCMKNPFLHEYRCTISLPKKGHVDSPSCTHPVGCPGK